MNSQQGARCETLAVYAELSRFKGCLATSTTKVWCRSAFCETLVVDGVLGGFLKCLATITTGFNEGIHFVRPLRGIFVARILGLFGKVTIEACMQKCTL